MQWSQIGAGFGFLGVFLGAFGAHGLHDEHGAPDVDRVFDRGDGVAQHTAEDHGAPLLA